MFRLCWSCSCSRLGQTQFILIALKIIAVSALLRDFITVTRMSFRPCGKAAYF